MPILLAIVPLILQYEPEVAQLIHDLFAKGEKVPTAEQLADLEQRRNARVAAQRQFEADANG